MFYRIVPEVLERLTGVERAIAQSVELGVEKPAFRRQSESQARVGFLPFLYSASEPDAPPHTNHLIKPSTGNISLSSQMEPQFQQPCRLSHCRKKTFKSLRV